mgnify:CR=1 FL=1
MDSRFHIFLFVLILIVLQACSQFSQKQPIVDAKGDVARFLLRPNQSININANEQLKNIEVVPLEGTPKSFVGAIEEVYQDSTTGRWYILDSKKNSAIIIFEQDGKFVKRIHNIGNGPGEYQQINDFELSDGKWIEVLDGRGQKLIKFDLETDTLISEKKVPFYAWEYSYLEDGNYVFFKNSQANNLEEKKYFHKILILDKDMNLLWYRFPFELRLKQRNFSLMHNRTFSKAAQKINFNEFLSDTIYSVTSDTIEPGFIIDYGEYSADNLDEEGFSSGQEKIRYLINHTDEIIMGIQHVTEDFNNVGFNFIHDNEVYTFLYDKISGEASIIGDIQYGESLLALPPPQKTIGSKYLGIYTWELLSQIPLDELNEDKESYSALILAKKEYKNPVLVLYNVKL